MIAVVNCDDQKPALLEKEAYELLIDLSCYSLSAVKKACYKFAGECAIAINDVGQNKIKLGFRFSSCTDHSTIEKIVNEFYSELMDQDLREIVFKETEITRNLILAHAFSKTALVESE